MHLATLDVARGPEAGICPDRFDSGGVVKGARITPRLPPGIVARLVGRSVPRLRSVVIAEGADA
jgi:hypothetical protein